MNENLSSVNNAKVNFETSFTSKGRNLGRNFDDYDWFMFYLNGTVSSEYSFHPINLEQLSTIVRSLINISLGHDNLRMSMYKDNFYLPDRFLLLICNESSALRVIPSDLNIAKVTAVFESGDRNALKNYNQISVLSYLSKIIEKVVAELLG